MLSKDLTKSRITLGLCTVAQHLKGELTGLEPKAIEKKIITIDITGISSTTQPTPEEETLMLDLYRMIDDEIASFYMPHVSSGKMSTRIVIGVRAAALKELCLDICHRLSHVQCGETVCEDTNDF